VPFAEQTVDHLAAHDSQTDKAEFRHPPANLQEFLLQKSVLKSPP
jgi:hypothetical protein